MSLPQRYRFFLLALLFPALHHDTLPYSKKLKTKKMEDDAFDGAVGIDLGTTYSYVSCL